MNVHSVSNTVILGSCFYHFFMGIMCMLGQGFVGRAMKFLYAIDLPKLSNPLFEYSLKPLGAFALWTGGVCATAYFYREQEWVIYIKYLLGCLFVIRASFRYFYRDIILEIFNINWNRSRFNVLFNLGLTLILFLSAYRGNL